MRLLPKTKRAGAAAATAVILLYLIVSTSSQSASTGGGLSFLRHPFPSTPRPSTDDALDSLPELAALSKPDVPEPEFCAKRFGPQYLDELRETRIQYCSAGSSANLTCFHSHTQSNDDRDSFCIGQGAWLNRESRRFSLDCDVRQPTDNESSHGIIPFSQIRKYWYDTGAGFLFESVVSVASGASPPSTTQAPSPRDERPVTILVKREGHSNIWHSLMEIWSMIMSLDVLRLSHDGDSEKAFFAIPRDIPRTQIVFLDDHEEGPLYPLWGMFAGREPVRLNKVLEDPEKAKAFETPQNLIIPLAGGSNPLWQNDWEDRDCQDAPLLKVFTRRVMQQFGVEFETGRRQSKGKPLKVTLIDRRGSRKLLDQDVLLAAARKKFPDADFQSIDLGAISFHDQLQTIQSTDILVGVHGAGLTHAMFLRENGAAVVEIQPSSMSHKGFRNLAKMLGHKYFSTHAEMVGHEEDEGKKRDLVRRDRWHFADVRIEEEAFLKLIEDAVESLKR